MRSIRCLTSLLLLALSLCGSHACNSVILKDDLCGDGVVVSASSFSEEWDLASGLLVVPKGGKWPVLKATPTVESAFGPLLTFKYATTCLGHDAQEIIEYNKIQVKPGQVPDNYYICNQGMNEKGLAVGFQNQATREFDGTYDPTSNKKPFNYFDLGAIILARYKSVAEVLENFAADFQATYSPDVNFFRVGQWLAIYDATGAAAVIQFPAGKKMQVLPNPLGVLANMYFPGPNDPLGPTPELAPSWLQEQTQKYKEYLTSQGLTYDEAGFINGPVWYYRRIGNNPVEFSQDPKALQSYNGSYIDVSTFTSIPGGYNGDTRFARLAVLKSAALLQCFPQNAGLFPTSPGVLPSGYPDNWPSLLTVQIIVNSVSLPRGTTDNGNINLQRPGSELLDAVLWYTMRDHDNKIFYYRAPNSLMYRKIDLTKVDWDDVPTHPTKFIPLRPFGDPGVLDFTDLKHERPWHVDYKPGYGNDEDEDEHEKPGYEDKDDGYRHGRKHRSYRRTHGKPYEEGLEPEMPQ